MSIPKSHKLKLYSNPRRIRLVINFNNGVSQTTDSTPTGFPSFIMLFVNCFACAVVIIFNKDVQTFIKATLGCTAH